MNTFLILVLIISALLIGIALLFGHLIGRVGDLNNVLNAEVCPGPGKCTDQGCPAHYADPAPEDNVTNFVTYPDRRKINLPKY